LRLSIPPPVYSCGSARKKISKKNHCQSDFSAFLYDLWGMDSVFTMILLGLAPFFVEFAAF